MAQPEKRENSVLFSLRELRQIEENRVAEEEQAARSAEEARQAAQAAAERRRREEEEAKVRAERDAQLAIETARENAEREARMRVESAEATERQRQQAALEQQRLQQEMELRRAEVAKKRPTWMLAVTDFKLRFYGSALGYAWTLVRPFAFFGVIWFVFSEIVHAGAGVKNYSAYILMSLVLFQFFLGIATTSLSSLVDRQNLLRKMPFPRLVIPMAVTLFIFFENFQRLLPANV